MYTLLDEHEVVTRKAHSCEWCAERIDKGETAHARSYVWDGGLFRGVMHPEGWAAMLETPNYDLIDGWSPGDWERPRAALGEE